MSFSFSISEQEIESTLSTAIDEKIAALPDGAGKEEAQRLHEADAIASAIKALAPEDGYPFGSASISGSSGSSSAQFSVHVTFKTVSPTD